jgi:signal transduction histidine kinase
MAETKLIISGPSGIKEILLNPKGTTLGRDSSCDVILDHSGVSRLHARISQDPFGRWIIEDTGSHNGVFVNGHRIHAQSVLPNQKVSICPFNMLLAQESDQQIVPGTSIRTTIPMVDKGSEENIVPYKENQVSILSPALMQNLNELTNSLLKLSSPSELYSEACLCLAKMFNTLVAVIRLPRDSELLSVSPDILACRFGDGETGTVALETSYLHISKRVLEAVRSRNAPVRASSGQSSDRNLGLTIVDEIKPHLVYSACINDLGEAIDVLYIDILENKSPKEMFDFVEAVARQINFIQKTLFFIELQKQEKALRQANIELKEKDRIKDEYVSRVTHDIKGHLSAIQSCLYIGMDESDGPLSEKQSDFLGRAFNRTIQLTDFVEELLNLTQMRLSGRLKVEPFSLSDSISQAIETVARKAKDKSITLSSDVESSVQQIIGDEFSIKEMITNLLFNAIKYTPENKTVQLSAKGYNDHIQIDISDTGIGIPEDEIGNVFDEFFRASNARKKEKDGTGLGLSIVKQIVDRHGGKISVQSQQDKGTTFTVILPNDGATQVCS